MTGVVAQAFSPTTREAEAGKSLWVWGWLDLYSEFQDSQSCIERPCLKNIYKIPSRACEALGKGQGQAHTVCV